jgi:hypothetical protein
MNLIKLVGAKKFVLEINLMIFYLVKLSYNLIFIFRSDLNLYSWLFYAQNPNLNHFLLYPQPQDRN